MEARRTFQAEAKSSKSMWIVVAAVLAILALGVAGAYLAKGLTPASTPASGHVVQTSFQAPDAMDRNAQILRARNAQTGLQAPDAADRNAQILSDRNAKPQYRFSETHAI